MTSTKNEPEDAAKAKARDDAKALKPAGHAQVRYEPAPPTAAEGKRIHRRRPLPMTPEPPEKT